MDYGWRHVRTWRNGDKRVRAQSGQAEVIEDNKHWIYDISLGTRESFVNYVSDNFGDDAEIRYGDEATRQHW